MKIKDKSEIKKIIELCIAKNTCKVIVLYDEPMKEHTTFKTGGPADCFLRPGCEGFSSFCINLLNRAQEAEIPVFILGGGANILVSDKGIRGIVLDTALWKSCRTGEDQLSINGENALILKSGTDLDEAAEIAAAAGLGGLEFLAGMPGTIGGAMWMNARCYGREIADVLSQAEVIKKNKNNEYTVKKMEIWNKDGFGYKESPFQKMNSLILSGTFRLTKSDKEKIYIKMKKNRDDRKEKGHYLFPCAGSAFKNNRDFGKPTGQIIDELGLKELRNGGAQVAPFHGNIIINTGNSTSADIRALMDEIAVIVKEKNGFNIEPEIIFAGEWD